MPENYFKTLLNSRKLNLRYGENSGSTVFAMDEGGSEVVDLEFDRVRGNVVLIAAAISSLEAARFILGTSVGGRNWLQLRHPDLKVDDTVIFNQRGGTIAEAIGITDFMIESFNSLDLLTVWCKDRGFQFLTSHSYVEFYREVGQGEALRTQNLNWGQIIDQMRTETREIWERADFRSLQRTNEWDLFLRVLNLAFQALGLRGSVEVLIIGPPSAKSAVDARFLEWSANTSESMRFFKIIANLAYGLYQPERLLQRPWFYSSGFLKWYVSGKYRPLLQIREDCQSSRQLLEARKSLDEWLRAGCLSFGEIEALTENRPDLETMNDRRHFNQNHRRSGFKL